MTRALFRVALGDGSIRLARGDSERGPSDLLAPDLTIDGLLAAGADALAAALASASAGVAAGVRVLAPVDGQEVWCAGVTYERSRDARMEESTEPSVYDRVYESERPELFFKAPGWRVRGPGETIGIRADSTWDVPEPELAVVVGADGSIAGLTIGDDVSSRTIEGDNPLFLPQAKVYDGSCALGPCIVTPRDAGLPADIRLEILRDRSSAFVGRTSTARIRRPLEELVGYLGRALAFPLGAVLMTGTGIVPDPGFTLRPGDVVRIEIDGLGRLENTVEIVGGQPD